MLKKEVAALLEQQINKEFYSAYLYLDMSNYYYSKNLDSEKLQTAHSPVRQYGSFHKHAGEDRPHRAAAAVDSNRTNRVIHLQDLIQKLYNDDYDKACNKADGHSRIRGNHIAAGGNGNKTRQSSVQCHGNIRLAIAEPGYEKHRDRSHYCSQVSGHGDITQIGSRTSGRTAVEAKPAEPENEYTQSAYNDVMARNSLRLFILIKLTDTGTDNGSAHKGTYTAYHMNCCGTGKIMEADTGKPSVRPDPVTGYRINENRNSRAVNQIC